MLNQNQSAHIKCIIAGRKLTSRSKSWTVAIDANMMIPLTPHLLHLHHNTGGKFPTLS